MGESSLDLGEVVQRGYRFAVALTHDATAAEDLVQEAWLRVLRAGGPRTPAYLFVTIRTCFIDYCRRRRRVAFESLADQDEPMVEDNEPRWEDDEPLAVSNGRLGAALGELRAEERAVLYLSAIEAYTAERIADVIGRPRGTVLSLLHRTRNKLKRSMQTQTEALL